MEKSLVFFKSTYMWKKIFISRYDVVTFIYKSWSVNSGWLTLFVRLKVTQGNSFDFKMLLTRAKFLTSALLTFKKLVKSSTLFFADKSVLPSKLTLLTENSLANCHFSKKDIFQIIRNSDSNKAHGMIWSAFVC